jgi:excisionase family DNA binding protein
MAEYLTTGQAARKLRVSVSTLKRWLQDKNLPVDKRRNSNGWRLFTDSEVEALREHKRELRRNGKRFNDTTLVPITQATDGNASPEKAV